MAYAESSTNYRLFSRIDKFEKKSVFIDFFDTNEKKAALSVFFYTFSKFARVFAKISLYFIK